MSSMAKIFVVVNLVFVLLVFGAAGALLGAQDDFKTELQNMKAAYQVDKDLWTKKNQASETEAREQIQRASLLETQKKEAEVQREIYQTQAREAATLSQKLSDAADTNSKELSGLREMLQTKQNEVATMQKRADDASKSYLDCNKKLEDEIANRVSLETRLSQLNEQVSALSGERGDLEKKVRDLEFWLGVYREKFGDIQPNEGATGVVLAVKGNLVSISVGSADGVKIGVDYHLRRGSQYVGRMRIKSVMKNQSVGEFDEEFAGSGAPPQVNDTAYVK